MKILHIIPSYVPALWASGPIQPTHFLNRELVRRGADVTVYTTNIDNYKTLDVPLKNPVVIDGVKIFYFPSKFPFWYWYYSSSMRVAIRDNIKKFDVVHITSVFLASSFFGGFYARRSNIPYIISPHVSLMSEPLQYHSLRKKIYLFLFEKKNLSSAILHFTVEKEREEYIKSNLRYKDSVIIPNSFDSSGLNISVSKDFFRKSFSISKNKNIILFLGRLTWKKGFDTLIPAFQKVARQRENCVLIIAGGDDRGYKRKIEELVEQYNVGADVIFVGELHGQYKVAALKESDVFALPSYSENFGMTIIEAMYCRLPVVVTKYVGISDVISDTGAGMVTQKDSDEIAKALLCILDDQKYANRIRECGERLVKERYSVAHVTDIFIDLYQKICYNPGNATV